MSQKWEVHKVGVWCFIWPWFFSWRVYYYSPSTLLSFSSVYCLSKNC
jgi:hypothetical protein